MKPTRFWPLLFTFSLFLMIPRAYSAEGNPGALDGSIFYDTGQSLGTSDTYAVAAADLDGDLDLDVVAGNSSFDQVWINNGSGQFTSGDFFGSPVTTSEAVALADLDHDNDIDAVIVFSNFPNGVFLNDGTGDFSEGQTLGALVTRGVAIGDLNGDGDPDIYFANQGMDEIWWNDGSGVFTDSLQTLETKTGYGVALEDLDSDGDLDAFVANGGGTGAFDTVWINQGGLQGGTEGDFLDSGQTLGFIWTEAVALGDLDGDSDLDAFTASWFPNPNKVWINDGSGTFSDGGSLGAEASIGVSLGDVDGDLDLDAFVGNNYPVGGKLWLNDGVGNFTDSNEQIAINTSVYASVLDDLNGNGLPDLFLGIFGPNQVWLNTGAGVGAVENYQPQIVDGRGDSGESTALVLDQEGNPHIAYTTYRLHREGLNHSVWYAYWDGVRWRKEFVDLVSNMGGSDAYAVEIALDSSGSPVIAYVTPSTLNIATRDGGAWQVETLDGLSGLQPRIGMSLDTQDSVHILNYTNSNNELVYRIFDGEIWTVEIIDLNVTGNAYPALALDSTGAPHVSYYQFADKSIRYAHLVSGNWVSDIVEDSTFPQDATFTSIAFDKSGKPAIIYNWTDEKEVRLARWNGSGWNIETALTVAGGLSITDKNGLAFDTQDNPHIIAAPGTPFELDHVFWDGSAWVKRVIDNGGHAGRSASMALDANDGLHVSYYDREFGDLRYITFGPEFETQTVDGLGSVQANAIGVRESSPTIGYYDIGTGLVKVAEYAAGWSSNPIAFSSNPVTGMSSATLSSVQHFSHYDADNGRLMYTRWQGEVGQNTIVDETGDVGKYNDITFAGQGSNILRIAYWDATNRRIKLAELNGSDPPTLHTNAASPGLNADSGYVSITPLPGGNVGVSYYDGINDNLRYAAWDSATDVWDDQMVDGAGTDAGRINDMQTDALDGNPVIAYVDETNDRIKLAFEVAGVFTNEVAVDNAGGVTGLSLALHFNSGRNARILYTTGSELSLAALKNGVWEITVLAVGGASTLSAPSLTLDDRMHFSYADSLNGLVYGFRSTNIEFGEAEEEPFLGEGFYNPMDGCIAVLGLFLGDEDDSHPNGWMGGGGWPLTPEGLTGPLTDQEIFGVMASLFKFTEGGQFYIDLYFAHGAEMGGIGLDDPVLLWDSYGALQNFMPGLEALVTGRGDELLISQEMADDALDIWQRIEAAANPELAGVIGTELAKYNNLQDFVGVSFDEWAEMIGVSPQTERIYLPLMNASP